MTAQHPRHHRARVENGSSARRERIRKSRHPERRSVAYRNLVVTDDWPRLVPSTATEKSLVESVVDGNLWFPTDDDPEQ